MSEFKVVFTYICTTAHYKILYRLTWGYNAAKTKRQNKTKPKKSHNHKFENSNNNNRRPAFRFTDISIIINT